MKNILQLIIVIAVVILVTSGITFYLWTDSLLSYNTPKQIRVIVPLPAGSGLDLLARVFADELKMKLNAQVVVINKDGGSGTLATEYFIKESSKYSVDILYHSALIVSATSTIKDAKYSISNDLIPLSIITESPLILVVNNKYNTFDHFINTMRDNKIEAKYAIIGIGGGSHFATIRLGQSFDIKIRGIPYKNPQQAYTDLINNEIDFMVTTIQSVKGIIEAGYIKPLLQMSAKRSNSIKSIPAINEFGYNTYMTFWNGVFVSKNTPSDVIEEYKIMIEQIKQSKSFQKSIEVLGGDISDNLSIDELKSFNQDEILLYRKIAKENDLCINEINCK